MSDLGIQNWKSEPVPVEITGAIPIPKCDCEAYHISYDIKRKSGEVFHEERTNILTPHGEFIVGSKIRACHQCGQETNLVEICYEAPFCSDECVAEYDKKCLAAMGGDY